jgi:hypothetical protein
MGGNFLEPVHPGNRKDPGFLADFQLIAIGSLDFFAVREPDYEHDLPLESVVLLPAARC